MNELKQEIDAINIWLEENIINPIKKDTNQPIDPFFFNWIITNLPNEEAVRILNQTPNSNLFFLKYALIEEYNIIENITNNYNQLNPQNKKTPNHKHNSELYKYIYNLVKAKKIQNEEVEWSAIPNEYTDLAHDTKEFLLNTKQDTIDQKLYNWKVMEAKIKDELDLIDIAGSGSEDNFKALQTYLRRYNYNPYELKTNYQKQQDWIKRKKILLNYNYTDLKLITKILKIGWKLIDTKKFNLAISILEEITMKETFRLVHVSNCFFLMDELLQQKKIAISLTKKWQDYDKYIDFLNNTFQLIHDATYQKSEPKLVFRLTYNEEIEYKEYQNKIKKRRRF